MRDIKPVWSEPQSYCCPWCDEEFEDYEEFLEHTDKELVA